MTELKYLPSAWQDECIPEPQENPNAFIYRAGDVWFLRPPESAEVEETYSQPLSPGDIVQFDEHLDTLAMSIEELISSMDMTEGEYSIDAYWWSDYEVPLRFVVEGDTARFERIEGKA